MYPWFAVPVDAGYPKGLIRGANPLNQLGFFRQQAGNVDFNGIAYLVGVLQSKLRAGQARAVRLEY